MRPSGLLGVLLFTSMLVTGALSQPAGSARLLLDKAEAALAAGEIVVAEQGFADAMAQVEGSPTELVEARNGLASILRLRGNAEEAVPLYLDNLRLLEAAYGPEAPETIRALGLYGVVLGELGNEPQSSRIAERVHALTLELLGPDHADTLAALSNLVAARYYSNDLAAAETLQRQVLAGWVQAFGETDPGTIEAQRNLAVILEEADQLEEAAIEYTAALAAARRHLPRNHPVALRLAASAATFMSRLDRTDISLVILENNIAAIAKTFGPNSDITRSAMGDLATARLLQGEQPLDVLSTFDRLVTDQLDSIYRRPEGAQSERPGIPYQIAEAAWLADAAAMVAIRALGPDPAILDVGFRAAQAPALGLTALATNRASMVAVADRVGAADLVAAWESASRRLAEADVQLSRLAATRYAPDTGMALPLAAMVAQRQTDEAELAAVEAELSNRFPAVLDMISPRPVTISELQGQDGLGPDDVVVLLSPSRFPGDATGPGRVWAVTHDNVAWADIPMSTTELADAVARLHALLSRPVAPGAITIASRAPLDPLADQAPAMAVRAYDGDLAFRLYSALFGAPDIAALLQEKPNWIVAPQGSLLSLSFAALLTQAPQVALDTAAALRSARWLGLERNIAVVPSLTNVRQVAAQRSKSKGGRSTYIGLGDPQFGAEPASVSPSDDPRLLEAAARGEAVRALPRLPGTRTEIEALAGLFGTSSRTLLGTDASEANLRALNADGSLAQVDILHFATHGLLAGSLPALGEPALALTPSDSGNDGDDGLLTSSEIAGLTLRVDWVILSACDTAAGATPDAEGLSGLARAFFYAGARSMLVSHWVVQDDIAARLIRDTVAGTTTGGLARPAALRLAMSAIVADTSRDAMTLPLSHPAMWAPFQLVGAD
ncbi:CHAT domain-containing tetratricopeptide repeat protein [Devosia sp. Root635]|uniref:CHAT domain-containing tetratricopeptide repeat protein n=1 Tax=Devosia sp. Root635 TaxID=1736575 RepID=UPI0006F824D6|nr:CHAT domain-containing tetratricopeptide repeat protein [Devosia sp. Root635]KRA52987.1 hypothetical protein ASD80_14405 [Devosia sp. Root635]